MSLYTPLALLTQDLSEKPSVFPSALYQMRPFRGAAILDRPPHRHTFKPSFTCGFGKDPTTSRGWRQLER